MTDNNVTKLKEPAVVSPGNYLQQAIAAGAGIDIIERILTAQASWDAMQAKKAYNTAIAAFKANPPKVLKDVEVNFGGGKASYKHEDLAALLAIVDPALAQHGLWVRYKVKTEDNGKVTVICVLGHADGHSEDAAELSSVPDTSGGKNPIQAIGSAVSYLQRYTTKAALGLAAAKDDDGRASGSPLTAITAEQADTINKILLEHFGPKAVEKFLALAGAESVSDIMAVKYDSCMTYLNRQLASQKSKK